MAQYVAIRALNRSSNIRVVASDNVYTLKVSATAGQFGLTVSNQTAGATDSTANTLAYNISAANLKTALIGLTTVPDLATANVAVSGGPGDAGGTTPYTIKFSADAGDQDFIITPIAGGTPLSGGTGASVTVVGRNVKLSTTVDTIVDLDRASNRRELSRHSAIGQWVVTAANAYDGLTALPANA